MNKMSPKERIEDELRAASSARRTPPGRLRTTEEDDRLLAAMAIADLANSLPAIARSPTTCLPGQPERVRQKCHPAKAPCRAESVANVRSAVNLKRKMLSVTTSVNNNDNKLAKVNGGERWITTGGDRWITTNTVENRNGNCRSDSKCKGFPQTPSVLCNGSLNPTTGVHVKSLSGLLGDLGRQQKLNSNHMLVNNSSSTEGNPLQTSRHPVCVVQPTVTFDEASATETHPTILTCFSEPRPLCISAPVFKLELRRPQAASFTVARPSSGVKVEQYHQAATQNVTVTSTNGNIPLSSHSTITGVKSIVPTVTSVHVTHSSTTDHHAKNPKRRNALVDFKDTKNLHMVGILTNQRMDAAKLPLKKRKLHGAHPRSVSPIVVTPHESKGQVVGLRTSAAEEQTADRSAASLPPTKIRLVKVEHGKEGEDASRQKQLASDHDSSKYL